jgi:AAA domain-containing protein
MTKITFTKAARKRAKLRLAISGVAGSGKTTAALEIATGLLGSNGGRIAVLDTEKGSASLYATSYEYDVMELDAPYTPERYIEVIHAAEEAGYAVLIIDSASPEWNGSGGCTEANEELAQAKFRGNTWSAWSSTTPRHRSFIEAMLQSKMHIIATFRAKEDTVQEGGKIRKVGMKMEARDGTSFEFSVVFELEHQSHMANVTKDRTRLFGSDPHKVTQKTGAMLLTWLEEGVEAPPSEAEVLAKRREDISHRFAAALNPDGDLGDTEEAHEAAICAAVFAVHNELRAFGIEEYQQVWQMIPAPSRAALKKYIEISKKEAA